MAVPLLVEERALGVLEVLDRPSDSRFTLAEMDLLGLFANQAAIALDLLQRARRARAALDGEESSARSRGSRRRSSRAPEEQRAAGLELLARSSGCSNRTTKKPRACTGLSICRCRASTRLPRPIVHPAVEPTVRLDSSSPSVAGSSFCATRCLCASRPRPSALRSG